MKTLVFSIFASLVTVYAQSPSPSDVLTFGDQFRQRYGNELKGKTSDGRACLLSVWDKSIRGDALCSGKVQRLKQKEAYISLGTSIDLEGTDASFSYIGFWINPDCSFDGAYHVDAAEVQPELVTLEVTADEGKVKLVHNKLLIHRTVDGKVLSVEASSSKYPSSVCYFNK